MKNIWIWICGGKPAVNASPLVPHHNSQGVAILLGIALAGCIWWMLSGGSLPSWGSGAPDKTPTPTPADRPAGDTITFAEVAKLLTSVPKGSMEGNTVSGNGSYISGGGISIYPNAKVVPPTYSRTHISVGGSGPVSMEIPIGVGKNISFTPPDGVKVEWINHAGESEPAKLGVVTPHRKAVRFTAKNLGQEVTFDVLESDIR